MAPWFCVASSLILLICDLSSLPLMPFQVVLGLKLLALSLFFLNSHFSFFACFSSLCCCFFVFRICSRSFVESRFVRFSAVGGLSNISHGRLHSTLMVCRQHRALAFFTALFPKAPSMHVLPKSFRAFQKALGPEARELTGRIQQEGLHFKLFQGLAAYRLRL